MGLFDKLRGRTPPPVPPVSVPPLVPRLAAVTPPRPLPVFPDDPLTGHVARLWRHYQRDRPQPTWHGFIVSLQNHNADLAAEIDRLARDADAYPSNARYRP